MRFQRFLLPAMVFTASIFVAKAAFPLGLELGETKDELKLKYEVSAVDQNTGRVTINLTIDDDGRLKPLDAVDLVIPSKEGTGYVDLSLSMSIKEVDGKRVARVHLKRELAERAQIQLKTSALDGKQTPLTWCYHAIPLAEFLKNAKAK